MKDFGMALLLSLPGKLPPSPSSSLAVCLTLLFLLHLRPLLFPPACNFVAPVIAQSADQTKEGPSPSPSPPPKRKNPRPPDSVRRDFPLFSSFDFPPLHSYAKIEHGLFLFSFAPLRRRIA